jgi:PAS domain S-box-containing protein
MSKPVIICIDDEPIILDSLKIQLKKAFGDEYAVETAESGEEALELVLALLEDEQEVALVISDYLLPTIKGDELLNRIHKISPETLKIMLTGQADLEAVGNAIKHAKLYRYIAKPWQTEDLNLTVKEAVTSYLQNKKLVEQNIQLQHMNQALEQLNHSQAILIAQLHENENRLRQFLEAMPVGVKVLDAEGKPYYINQKAKEIFGKGIVPDTTSKHLSEVYQIYQADTAREYPVEKLPFVRALRGETVTADDLEIHRGSKVTPLEVWATPIYDAQGNIVYAINAFQDITERKQTQVALLKAQQKYRTIFENALEGIYLITFDGRYINANTALASIYGYDSPQELMASMINIQCQLYVEPHRWTEFVALMQQHGAVSGFESMVYRQDGSIIWISEHARTVYDANGVALCYQGFVEDITERKKAEAERLKFTDELFQLNQALSRFVPRQFLQLLNKKSLVDVQLGDQVQQEMSVLFSDIRDFTALSETMTPQENFKFINAYLSRMEPAIVENQGFIDKYIGDGIMALFSGSADDALKAGISMLQNIAVYNQHRAKSGCAPIRIGMGINTGTLMLGTVGGQNRMDGTVISDAVNLASRLEELTKYYGVSLLISHHTLARLHNPNEYSIRFIAQVKVKGKSKAVAVFEVLDADEPEIKQTKLATKALFEEGLFLYYQQLFGEAIKRFEVVLSMNPKDRVTQLYRDLCHSQEAKIQPFPLAL